MLGLGFSILQRKTPTLLSVADCLTVAGAFLLTVLLAKITWWAFEARSIKLGHSVSYNGSTQRPFTVALFAQRDREKPI
jgi:peptidoglycan/LPS O-acetylase OafA/YrhL